MTSDKEGGGCNREKCNFFFEKYTFTLKSAVFFPTNPTRVYLPINQLLNPKKA